MKTTLKTAALAATALIMLSGCDAMKRDERPQYGSLARTLYLVDANGVRFGTIEMDPVTGGRLLDPEGRLIGTVVTPAVTSTVTTTTPIPVAPQY